MISQSPPTYPQRYPEAKKEVSWVMPSRLPLFPLLVPQTGQEHSLVAKVQVETAEPGLHQLCQSCYQTLSKSAPVPDVFQYAKYEQPGQLKKGKNTKGNVTEGTLIKSFITEQNT